MFHITTSCWHTLVLPSANACYAVAIDTLRFAIERRYGYDTLRHYPASHAEEGLLITYTY